MNTRELTRSTIRTSGRPVVVGDGWVGLTRSVMVWAPAQQVVVVRMSARGLAGLVIWCRTGQCGRWGARGLGQWVWLGCRAGRRLWWVLDALGLGRWLMVWAPGRRWWVMDGRGLARAVVIWVLGRLVVGDG